MNQEHTEKTGQALSAHGKNLSCIRNGLETFRMRALSPCTCLVHPREYFKSHTEFPHQRRRLTATDGAEWISSTWAKLNLLAAVKWAIREEEMEGWSDR